jgi:hypothetical protein
MSTRIQRRGGTALEHSSFLGAPREITVDTSNNSLRLHDGVLTGGHHVFMGRDAGYLSGRYNNIVNPDFDVWQRGDSGFTSSGYCADGWYWRPSTGTSSSIVKSYGGPDGSQGVPGNPYHYAYIAQSVAGTENCYVENRMEDVRTLNGCTATVTFYVKPDAAMDIGCTIIQDFGTGGSPSSQVGTQALALTSYPSGAWIKVQVVVDIPSITGKTVGTNGDDYLALRISMDPTATWVLRLTKASIVYGDVTYMDDPGGTSDLLDTISRCKRYYRRLGQGLSGETNSSAQVFLYDTFEIPMAAAPSITLLTTTPSISTLGTTFTGSGSAIDDTISTASSFTVRINGFSGMTGGNPAYVRPSYDILAFDSSL